MKNNIYTCIEFGSYEIKILVCNIREERLFVIAQRCIESVGIDRGQITNFSKLVAQIKKLKELVEADLKQPLTSLTLTVAPLDVLIEHTMGKINLDVKQAISTDDVKKLFRQVMEQPHDPSYLPIDLMPRLFRIDENHIVQNPCGLSGMSLAIEAQRLLVPTTIVSNLIHATESSGFKVDDIVTGNVSEAFLALTAPEMYAKSCHINIGHSMTVVVVTNEGKVLHIRTLPIGGRDISRAIAERFDIPEKTAQQLKCDYGEVTPHAKVTLDNQVIYVENNTENKEMMFITRGMLNEIVTDCSERLFQTIKDYIVDEMRLKEQEYHYSLAGGMANLPNVASSLQNQLLAVATIYQPTMIGARDSKFSSLIGVGIFAHETALLLGQNLQKLKFETGERKFLTKTAPEKQVTPSAKASNNNTSQSLKNAIAKAESQTDNEAIGQTKARIFGEFDETPFLEAGATEMIANEYIDKKLESSGVLGKFIDKFFNETIEEKNEKQ